jgi:hypothetical protein
MFNFLKPTHSLFGFFTSLCDAYSRVLMPEKGLDEKLKRDINDRCEQAQPAFHICILFDVLCKAYSRVLMPEKGLEEKL